MMDLPFFVVRKSIILCDILINVCLKNIDEVILKKKSTKPPHYLYSLPLPSSSP